MRKPSVKSCQVLFSTKVMTIWTLFLFITLLSPNPTFAKRLNLKKMTGKESLATVLEVNHDWISPPSDKLVNIEYKRVVSALSNQGLVHLREEWVSYCRDYALSSPKRYPGIPLPIQSLKEIAQHTNNQVEISTNPDKTLKLSIQVSAFPDEPGYETEDPSLNWVYPIADITVDPKTGQILKIEEEDKTFTCLNYTEASSRTRFVPQTIVSSDGSIFRYQWLEPGLWVGKSRDIPIDVASQVSSAHLERLRPPGKDNFPDTQIRVWCIELQNIRINKGPKMRHFTLNAEIDGDPEIEQVTLPYWYPVPSYIGALVTGEDIVCIRPLDMGEERKAGAEHPDDPNPWIDDEKRQGFFFIGIQDLDNPDQIVSIPVKARDPAAADRQLEDGTLVRDFPVGHPKAKFTIQRQVKEIKMAQAPNGVVYKETWTLRNGPEPLHLAWWKHNLRCDDNPQLNDVDGDGQFETLVCLNNYDYRNIPALALVYSSGPVVGETIEEATFLPWSNIRISQDLDKTVEPNTSTVIAKGCYVISKAVPPADCVEQVKQFAKVLLME